MVQILRDDARPRVNGLLIKILLNEMGYHQKDATPALSFGRNGCLLPLVVAKVVSKATKSTSLPPKK